MPDRDAFLNKLAQVNFDTDTLQHLSRDIRTCAHCNTAFKDILMHRDGWYWPKELAHYITFHNAHPDPVFVSFIEAEYGRINKGS